jgi:hypothetical protein
MSLVPVVVRAEPLIKATARTRLPAILTRAPACGVLALTEKTSGTYLGAWLE